jgi:hypothetical protein
MFSSCFLVYSGFFEAYSYMYVGHTFSYIHRHVDNFILFNSNLVVM